MKKIIYEGNSESRIYRKLFEFIKTEGIDSILKFVKDLQKLKEMDETIEATIFKDKHFSTRSLISDNEKIVKFLREFKNDFLYLNYKITSEEFYDFILYVFII